MSIPIKDGASSDTSLKSTEQSGSHLVHHIIEGIAKTSASYAPAADPDDVLPLAVDKDSGAILCHTRRLDYATDNLIVRGELDHDAVDSVNNVVKTGGKATNATSQPAAVASGDRCGISIDVYGRQRIVIGGMDTVTCYSSAARTAAPTTMTSQNNLYAKGCLLFIGVTALTGSPSVQFILEGLTPLSGAPYFTIIEKTVTATGTYVLRVYPGFTAVANEAADGVLSTGWRVRAVHANGDSITYNVALQYIP
jgi:hypothetical protein